MPSRVMGVPRRRMDVCVYETGDNNLVRKVDFQGSRRVQRRSGNIRRYLDYFMARRDNSHVMGCRPARSRAIPHNEKPAFEALQAAPA